MADTRAIRLPEDMLDQARTEGALMSRSAPGQIEFWARIGRAIEHSPGFDYNKIKNVLLGRTPIDALSDWEKAVYDSEHESMMRTPTAQEQRAHGDIAARAAAAGIDPADLGA